MKYKDIITLVQGGLMAASAHSLPVEHYYKFHKFRRAVARAYGELGKEQEELMKEMGVTQQMINTKQDDPAVIAFDRANADLLEETVQMNLPARIPYEHYRGIYDENRTPRGDIFASFVVEELVLDNLFTEPTETVEDDSDDEK